MPNNVIIETVTATGEEIHAIVSALEPVLQNVKTGHAIIACLEIVFVAMNPSLTADELHEGVRSCSEWISLYMMNIGEQLTPGQIN